MKNWLIPALALVICASLTYWMLRSRPPGPANPTPRTTGTVTNAPMPSSPAPTPSPVRTNRAGASTPSPAVVSASASATVTVRAPNVRPASAPAALPAPAAPSSSSVAVLSSEPPEILLESMRTTVRQYGLMFGGNPVGSNAEITQALNGDNPKQVNFLGRDANKVNGIGELIDAWGTPYFFHQLSAMQMEIRSAGPDRIMWTADDLVMQ